MSNISCNIIKDLLPSYADCLLSKTSVKLAEEHLESCPECRRFLSEIQAGQAAREEAGRKELAFLRGQKEKNRKTAFRSLVAAPAAAAVVMLLLIASHRITYPIRPDGSNYESVLFENAEVIVHGDVKIDNHRYILYETGGKLCYADLESDFTGWYKINDNE